MAELIATRRLFFGLWPDAVVRAAIIDRFSQMPQYALQATAMQPENLHLTLHFIGNVDAAMTACVQDAAQAVRGTAFDLRLDRVGYFAQAKIFWMGCTRTPSDLLNVHQQLADALLPCGYQAESQPFTPHVSLLRKVQQPGVMSAFKSIHWPVKSFALIESLPSSTGVIYRPVQNYFL